MCNTFSIFFTGLLNPVGIWASFRGVFLCYFFTGLPNPVGISVLFRGFLFFGRFFFSVFIITGLSVWQTQSKSVFNFVGFFVITGLPNPVGISVSFRGFFCYFFPRREKSCLSLPC